MNEATSTIRVLIADDHPVTRQGLRALLEAAPDIEVVGEAEDGREAQQQVAAHQPDILLLDLVMPGLRPAEIQLWVQEHHPQTTTLVLTAHDRDAYLAQAVQAGAAGFPAKGEDPQRLIAAIRCAAQGEVLLTPEQWARIRAWEEDVGARWEELSAREREILVLLAQGQTSKEIAEAMVITENTVRTHIGNLLGKLEVDSREAAIAWAWKHGFVEEGNDAEGS
ncbi:MAG: response regulator [Anaerolineales bacterium]